MATIQELQERLALYRQTEKAILTGGQEYWLRERKMSRASLAEIRAEIANLEHRLALARNNGQFGHSVAVFGGRR